MTFRKSFRGVVRWTAVAILAVCLVQAGRSFVDRLRYGSEMELDRCFREAARCVPSGRVGLLCKDAGCLTPVERSLAIAVNWEIAPRAVESVELGRMDTSPPVVLVSSNVGQSVQTALRELGLRPGFANELATVWSVGGTLSSPVSVERTGRVREGLSVLVVMVLFGWMVCRLSGVRLVGRGRLWLAGAIFILLSVCVLSHGLLPPNGLGVQAGKAKLLLSAGGCPSDYWKGPSYAVYQPSYPPGLTCLAWLVFVLAGGCGDWLVQLLSPWAMTLLFLLLTDGHCSLRRLFVAASFVLCPIAQKLTSGFYAEPFALLCLAAGIRRVRSVSGSSGWLLVGCAGLFRHEGLMLAAALWLAERISRGAGETDGRDLFAVLLPGVVWQVLVRCWGAGLCDYDFQSLPDVSRMAAAGRAAVHVSCLRFWELGGAGLFVLLHAVRCRPHARSVLRGVALGAAFVLGLVLLGFNTAPHVDWLIGTLVPRFVWLCLGLCFSAPLRGQGCFEAQMSAFCYNTQQLCWNSSKRR